MLKVQEYLRNGKTLEDLNAELGINHVIHPTLPFVILNYDQIESPKTHQIVRECRALILHKVSYEIIARSFFRFFNWGENQEEMNLFDFSNFSTLSKEDGSLVSIFNYNGEWHCTTRGSFALDNMQFQSFTWREGICKALGVSSLQELNGVLNPGLTYVCEFVSPWNKVVRIYKEPKLYLLTTFRSVEELNELPKVSLFSYPQRFEFKGIQEIIDFLQEQESKDPTFEGVVIKDRNGLRYKVKNKSYLSFHKMRGEGDNLYNPKHLLNFVLSGEESELILYFPEVEEKFIEIKKKVNDEFVVMMNAWEKARDFESQKEFALSVVKDTKFSGVLFEARKLGTHPKDIWRKSEQLILKKLF